MNTYINPSKTAWADISARPSLSHDELSNTINEVFMKVAKEGDSALYYFNEKFDHYKGTQLRVTKEEIDLATTKVDDTLKKAIQLAKSNIEAFHKAQVTNTEKIETTQGVTCWQESKGIEKVGLYIPGGTAPLFSTILMLGVPATIAGCKEIILTTPPRADGTIHPCILYTAQLVGIDQIYKVGGSQAIAAMSIGTESIPKVYKIFGPGNQYVTAAKQKALELQIAIDLPAGPSELLVLAGDNCVPAYVAADLLSQAEHGVDSQVLCVVEQEDFIAKIKTEIEAQLALLPRKDIASEALKNSRFVYLEKLQDRIDFINEYAPEHYIICATDEKAYLSGLLNAGSVFIGNYTPESAGDYASGTNHTLPTSAYAKNYSGVNMDAFVKKISFQKITKQGIQHIGPSIAIMAQAEELEAHANAVTIRLQDLALLSKP